MIRRHRFVNRLTPVTMTGKATEKGLEDVGRSVPREHFSASEGEADQKGGEGADERKPSVSKRSSSTRISSHFVGSQRIALRLREEPRRRNILTEHEGLRRLTLGTVCHSANHPQS